MSLQRFQQAAGRSDRPAPDDAQWMQWRRDQVTKLVKRVYLNMLAHKPAMELSVAAIAWGAAPPNGDWKQSSPYVRTLQDWAGWLQAGYIDWALPMAYFRQDERPARRTGTTAGSTGPRRSKDAARSRSVLVPGSIIGREYGPVAPCNR